ncbi:hypothetical protein H5410_038497 [Solanum commersonii]|uniref:Uncharacterized protein n=1 Tax=Solanum commersonii TaxID=4109 RepID=A0A9J5YA95_SOLCO|nr:hypothetical protein H5410_038497 [Solanum commersonii]
MSKFPSNMGIVFEYSWLEADSRFEVYGLYNDLNLLYDTNATMICEPTYVGSAPGTGLPELNRHGKRA